MTITVFSFIKLNKKGKSKMKKKFVKFFIFGFASICGISILSTNAKAITYQDLYTNYRVKDCEYVEYDLNTYYKILYFYNNHLVLLPQKFLLYLVDH